MTFLEIKNRVYFLTSTDVNSYTNANLDISIKAALNRIVSLLNRHDSRWQWDDSNNTDLPIAKEALVSGQQDYPLATTHLTIDRIELKDSSGSWRRLSPIDQQNLKRNTQNQLIGASGQVSGFGLNPGSALAVGESSRTGAYQATTGLPKEYDIIGTSLFLYPIPNYSQASSLFIYFTRGIITFSYATGAFVDETGTTLGFGTTASSPGFNPIFHDLVPLWASYDYAMVFKPQIVPALFNEIQRKEQELIDFQGRRDRDTRARFSVSNDSNK